MLLAEPQEVYIDVAAMTVEDEESVLTITYSRLRYKYAL